MLGKKLLSFIEELMALSDVSAVFLLPIITPSLAQTNAEESVSSIAFFHYTIQTLEDARLQESVCHYLMEILAGDRPLLDVVLGNMLGATNKVSLEMSAVELMRLMWSVQ